MLSSSNGTDNNTEYSKLLLSILHHYYVDRSTQQWQNMQLSQAASWTESIESSKSSLGQQSKLADSTRQIMHQLALTWSLMWRNCNSILWQQSSNNTTILFNHTHIYTCTLYLPNFHIQARNYYTVIYSRLVAFPWSQDRWSLMMLNGHFALKSVLGSPSNRLACSGCQTKLLGNLQSYIHTVSGKNIVQDSTFLVM